MGIRYYGWAVMTEEITRALHDPWSVIRTADQRGETSDSCVGLDKAWCLLQGLFRGGCHDEPRPRYALVAGDVTFPESYERGYEPHVGVLPPAQVRLIARDVATLGAVDVRSYSAGLCYDDERARLSDCSYLTHYLQAAQTFTADAAAHGRGIVDTIG